MNIFGFVLRLRQGPDLNELAEEIAARSRAEVWRRTHRRAMEMGTHEARGYIRARSSVVIHKEASAVCQTMRRVASAKMSQLIDMAMIAAIRQALDDLRIERNRRKHVVPAVALRRAA